MDAAIRQQVNEEVSHQGAAASASETAGPLEEVHERIATAFAGEDQSIASDAAAAPAIGEVSNRFTTALEGQAEADSQSRQQTREELNILKDAVRDLCDATVFFSSHTTQRFADVVGTVSASDNKLAALAADHAAHADRLEAAGRTIRESESRLASLTDGHAAHADRLETADRTIRETESRLANLTDGVAAHADRLETAGRTIKDTESALANLTAGNAAHGDRLETADRNIKAAESRLASVAAGLAAHADRLETADRNSKAAESRLASLAAGQTAHADRLETADRNSKAIESRLASLAAGQTAHANGLEAVHQRLRDSDALIQQFSKQLEQSNNRFSVLDASILMLVDHNKGVNDRLNSLQAGIRRLEESLSTLDRRLEVVAGLAGPVDVLREQNIELANQQRELRRVIELVCEQAREARASEEQFARRITATERKMSDSAERIEWISRWQSRIGQAFSSGPRD